MAKDITGRDALLIQEALAHTIALLDTLPRHRRPSSNRDDMADLLASIVESKSAIDALILKVYSRCGMKLSLSGKHPDEIDPFAAFESISEHLKSEIRAHLDADGLPYGPARMTDARYDPRDGEKTPPLIAAS